MSARIDECTEHLNCLGGNTQIRKRARSLLRTLLPAPQYGYDKLYQHQKMGRCCASAQFSSPYQHHKSTCNCLGYGPSTTLGLHAAISAYCFLVPTLHWSLVRLRILLVEKDFGSIFRSSGSTNSIYSIFCALHRGFPRPIWFHRA